LWQGWLGGAGNVQDIYPLAPLQQGLLFHHLLRGEEGDPYVLAGELSFDTRAQLDRYLEALQAVIDRHDILRTAVVWEGISEPVQVVWRKARLKVEEVELSGTDGDAAAELYERFNPRRYRIDIRQAPMLRHFVVYEGEKQRWVMMELMHHLVGDHTTLAGIQEEIQAHLLGQAEQLPAPLPFRNLVAQALLGTSREEHEVFFQQMLGDVSEPTAPFGLLNVQRDGAEIGESRVEVDALVARRVRERARKLGVSAASIFHLAWALVLSKLSGQQDVVFGTVLFGRMQGGAGSDRAMGLFINTLPVRIHIGEEGAEASVRRMHMLLADLLRHEHASLALAQRCSGVRAPLPLFSALFNYRHGARRTQAPSEEKKKVWAGVQWLYGEERTNYPCVLSVDDFGDDFKLTAQVDTSIKAERVCDYMSTSLVSVVAALEGAPSSMVSTLAILSLQERHRMLQEWNQTDEVLSCQCIHELFEEQVSQTPDGVAVVYEGESLSYGELNRRANQLGHYLRELGVKPDARVGICLERSLAMVVALLGVLKAGGAYVPLDPNHPPERLSFMLEDSAPTVLLTQGSLQGLLPGVRADLPLLDVDAPLWERQPETNPERESVGLKPNHLAYVIYTSGSTGTPKGVMVEHRNVSRLFAATDKWFQFSGKDVWTLFHSYAFDFSVWEIWGALLYGGRLIVVAQELSRSPEDFYRLVCAEGVTVLNQTPSAFRSMMVAQGKSDKVHCLRLVIFGGEALEVGMLKPWYEHNGAAQTQLVNMYGITETTVHVSYRPLERGDTERQGDSPIGQRICDLRTYILDGQTEPVPERVCGELYVGGAGMARGYLNRPGLTAERFVPDPFAVEPGARMYRTGDLGRYRADGNIEFLGRNDFQVKVRGFRIELGEIEARLSEQSGVREAVVIAREDVAGEKRLVAYVVGEADAGQLRMHLQQSLPGYMVPAAFVILERLPLTPNGKLDRKALPAPDEDAYARRGDEAPVGEIERALAVIWAEVLKLEQIGRYDNFFELGGHSLLAVTMIERMRREGFKIDVRTLFATPTIAELAASVIPQERVVEVPANKIPEGCEVLTPEMLPLVRLTGEEIERIVAGVAGGAGNVQDIYPLAPLQQGLLFHHLLRGEEGDPYVLAGELSFDTRAQLDRYLEALQAVIDRHDILRTAVVWEGISEPVQVVWRKARLKVEEVELSGTDGDAAAELYERFNPRRYRIDIRQAPMLRHFVVYEGEKQRWVMMELMHHLVGDHTTLAGIQEEIQAHLLGQAEQLPAPLPFRNLVAQALLGTSREEHEVFFQQMLGDVSEPTAPFGLLNVQRDGAEIGESRVEVDALVARRVRERARKLGVSAASIFHLAWALVLSKLSGQQDVVFGTVLFGRMQGGAGSDRAMGLFINTLPVRIHIGEEGAEASVRRMHMLLADLLRHEHASLALAQRCSGVRAPLPLFSALFNYRHGARRTQAPSEEKKKVWAGVQWLYGEERTNYPCVLSVDDFGDDFKLTAQVDTSIKAERVCDYMSTSLVSVVAALEGAPSSMVSTLAILSLQERHRMLQEWNQTDEVLSCQCIHELFEEQVSQTPDGVAVVYEGESLSYGELNRRANQLGHYLRELGVKPDARVGICLERSLAMVVALLGVLKAGGAYVPLDPNHPPERLSFMLEDSAPTVLLTQGSLQGLLPGVRADLPLLDVDAPLWERQPETNPERESVGLKPNHLAYVIYTSGSTGTPKGVMVEHRNVSRLFAATDKWFQFSGKDVWTLFHSYAFDFSVWEIWGALLYGGRLIVVAQELSRSPEDFYRLVCAEGVTVLNQTPSAFRSMMVAQGKSDKVHCLRLVIFGGEALEVGMLKPWYEHNGAAQTQLVNMYGITETTVHVSYRPLERGDTERQGDSPIGQRICDLRTYILDGQTEPVPERVCGELYVGGAGMARGYLNRPGLTAERFVPDPFAVEPGARMYRTGDLGRYRADGNIEFLGRNDFQVKVRGFRIELGEIEARLSEQSGVREAVVIAREDVAGEKRLVAYVVGEADAGQLRMHLQQSLPEYMVPAAFVILERLPLTPNGKLDRKALPMPDVHASIGAVSPRNEVEKQVAEIWKKTLGISSLGIEDNFFDLGGNSILLYRVFGLLRSLRNDLQLVDLFRYPTVSAIAAYLAAEATPSSPPHLVAARARARHRANKRHIA
jgi:amino acid adenylation domain-containing protein